MEGAVANRIICNIFLYGKHGDDSDMMFLSIASMDGLKKAAGLGGAQLPPFANRMIRTTFPYCNHGDDMMLHFYSRHGWLRKKQGCGGRGVELASQHLLLVFIRARITFSLKAQGLQAMSCCFFGSFLFFAGFLLSFYLHYLFLSCFPCYFLSPRV